MYINALINDQKYNNNNNNIILFLYTVKTLCNDMAVFIEKLYNSHIGNSIRLPYQIMKYNDHIYTLLNNAIIRYSNVTRLILINLHINFRNILPVLTVTNQLGI